MATKGYYEIQTLLDRLSIRRSEVWPIKVMVLACKIKLLKALSYVSLKN